MKAMNGFVGLLGKRARLVGCCTLAMLVLGGLASAVPAGAVEPPPVKTYLALGDSLAFGYTAVKKAENFPNEVPSYFEEGYADFYAKKLRGNTEATNKGLILVNNGCPGETSGGLTGNLATNRYGKKEVKCFWQTVLPMHNPYIGHTQLEDTIGILTTKNPVTATTPAHPVEVISLNIGGNDELEGVSLCEREVKEEFEHVWSHEAMVDENSKVMKAVSGYEGVRIGAKIFGQGVPSGTTVEKLSNAEEVGKTLTMSKAATETTGLTEYKFAGTSQYGSTPEGALNGCLIAHLTELEEKIGGNVELAGGAIRTTGKYAGPLLVLNGYNPNAELLKGSDGLVAFINGAIKRATEKVGGTYVNVFKTFNPQGNETKEQATICKYTEMCNPVAVALHEAEVGTPLPATDGDIHPSKVGAETISKLMFELVKA